MLACRQLIQQILQIPLLGLEFLVELGVFAFDRNLEAREIQPSFDFQILMLCNGSSQFLFDRVEQVKKFLLHVIELLSVDCRSLSHFHFSSGVVDVASAYFFSSSGSNIPIDSELLGDRGGELDQFGFLGIFRDGQELDDEVGHFVFLSQRECFFISSLDGGFEEQNEPQGDFVVLESFDVIGVPVAPVVLKQLDPLIVVV